MRLVLDEHLDSAIARELRRRGHDAIAVTERHDLRELGDADLLAWSTDEHRVLVTYDVGDFRPLAEARLTNEEPVAGLIFVSSRSYPQTPRVYGRLIRDLAAILEANRAPDAFAGRMRWLGSG